jgi:hypothetical protein
LEGKEIEEIEEEKDLRIGGKCEADDSGTKVRRTFTRYDRPDYRNCQYIKWVLVFRNWAQHPGAMAPRRSKNTVTNRVV